MNKQAYEASVNRVLNKTAGDEVMTAAAMGGGMLGLGGLMLALKYALGRRYKTKHINAAKATIQDMTKKLEEMEKAGQGNTVRAKMYADQLSLASDDLRRWEQTSPWMSHYFK